MKRLAAVIASTAAVASARDIKTADGRKTRQPQPQVQLGVNDDLCFFENNDDKWCIAATPPMVKAGIEWDQTWTSTPSSSTPVVQYYQVELKPFVQIQANLINTLFIQGLWVDVLTLDLDQFKMNMYISLIIND